MTEWAGNESVSPMNESLGTVPGRPKERKEKV